ncbi:MAG: hypothetical protein IJO60_02015 [Agathobacter sp.]|nr:hypothetical protein [Agathobacter sp.]
MNAQQKVHIYFCCSHINNTFLLWILYGITIVLGIIGGLIVGDSLLLVAIYCGSLLLPIVIMVLYHKKLVKDYIIE